MTTTAVREYPILFTGPMVRAILDGSKTQTRRVAEPLCNPLPSNAHRSFRLNNEIVEASGDKPGEWIEIRVGKGPKGEGNPYRCPYGQPGDRLWVRETFIDGWPTGESGEVEYCDEDGNDLPKHVWYRASEGCLTKYPIRGWQSNRGAVITGWTDGDGGFVDKIPWKPSIHMPRWACRMLLEITDVRVQRLHDMNRVDAFFEGCPYEVAGPDGDIEAAHRWFVDLWDSINAKRGYGWDTNPWVWCISFKRID